MPVQENTKKSENEGLKQSNEKIVQSDIENALNFLDSDEYREAPQPVRSKKEETENRASDKTRCDAAKQAAPQRSSMPSPRKDAPSSPPIPAKSKQPSQSNLKEKNPKVWLLCLGAAVLLALVIFFLL